MSFEFNCATQVCTGSTGYRLPVGTEGGSKWRAALQFDLGGVPAGATITDANLRLLYDGSCISDSSSCGGVSHKLDLHRMTGAWKTDSQTSDLKWDKTAPLASYTLGSGAAAPKWLSWNVTPTVKSWLSGSTPNFGFLLKDSQEEPDKSGPRFPGKRYLAERSLRPALEVTWSSTGVTLLPPDVIHSDGAELNWTTESLGSQTGYEIHRSDDPGFAPSETTRLTVIRDAAVDFYRDTTAAPDRTFTYKVVSLSGNQVSNRQTVRTPLAGETTVTVQPDASSGRAANITYYSNPSDPTTVCNNFGASTGMRVGTSDTKRFRGLLHFDLRRIPSTATITSASLKVYHEATTADVGALEVHRVTRVERRHGHRNLQRQRRHLEREPRRGQLERSRRRLQPLDHRVVPAGNHRARHPRVGQVRGARGARQALGHRGGPQPRRPDQAIHRRPLVHLGRQALPLLRRRLHHRPEPAAKARGDLFGRHRATGAEREYRYARGRRRGYDRVAAAKGSRGRRR